MALTRREERVITAFINCIAHGEYTEDYAITLIEDNQRYGWMSDAAKDTFYEMLDELNAPPVVEPEPIVPEPVEPDEPTEPDEPIEPEPQDESDPPTESGEVSDIPPIETEPTEE